MVEGSEEVEFSSVPLVGTNRVSLRILACSGGEMQLQHSSYSQAEAVSGYLHLKQQ